jgi:ABC-type lipoprotein release transport system permease subunit
VAATAVLFVTGALAVMLPAIRAGSGSPAEALRAE